MRKQARRGRCSVCGGDVELTKAGRVKAHPSGNVPALSRLFEPTFKAKPCPGAGQLPKP